MRRRRCNCLFHKSGKCFLGGGVSPREVEHLQENTGVCINIDKFSYYSDRFDTRAAALTLFVTVFVFDTAAAKTLFLSIFQSLSFCGV